MTLVVQGEESYRGEPPTTEVWCLKADRLPIARSRLPPRSAGAELDVLQVQGHRAHAQRLDATDVRASHATARPVREPRVHRPRRRLQLQGHLVHQQAHQQVVMVYCTNVKDQQLDEAGRFFR